MFKVNQNTDPNIFLSRFQKPSHSYSIRFSELNYVQPTHNTQFQLEDHISGTASLAPKKNKSILCINLKL